MIPFLYVILNVLHVHVYFAYIYIYIYINICIEAIPGCVQGCLPPLHSGVILDIV